MTDPARPIEASQPTPSLAGAITPPASSGAPAPPPAPGDVPPPIEVRHAPGWHTKDVVRATLAVIATFATAWLVWFANPLFLTAFLGALLGLAVASGVDHLERLHIPRGVGAVLVVGAFFGLLFGFGAWVTPTLREQGVELKNRLPESLDRVEQWVNQHRNGFLGTILGDFAPDTTTNPPPPAPVVGAKGQAENAAVTLRERITRQLSGATRYLFPFLSSTLAVLGGLLIMLFLSLYIGADPGLYRRGIVYLFPHESRERASAVLTAVATVLRRWLVTQFIAMLTIGTVTTIALLILGIKAAFALGILAGLFEFIPTVGPILSAIPAVAMGFLDSPQKAVTVALVFWGIQFAENHLLIPLLMKGGVHVPPVMTILAQALMAIVFGFLGLMCAVPLLAAGMTAVKMIYVDAETAGEVTGMPGGAPKDAAPA